MTVPFQDSADMTPAMHDSCRDRESPLDADGRLAPRRSLPHRYRLVVLIGVAAAITALVRLTPLGEFLMDFHRWRILFDQGDLWAEVLFLPITAMLVAAGAPRLVFYCLGGVTFGFWKGLLLAQVGTLAGAYATYLCVRWGGRAWVNDWFSRRPSVQKVLAIQPSVWSVLMVRQLPVGGVVINVGLGLSPVRTMAFLAGSFLGFLPQGIAVTLVGSGLVEDHAWEAVAQLAVAAVVVLIFGLWIGHKTVFRKKA
jgi:uncharacterized membrane protein YdjX (TVP38/TMEM64 family)